MFTTDSEVVEAGTSDGWNIHVMCQPPNSPDLNVLDLGYFASIQALQYEEDCYNAEDLIQSVQASFQKLEDTKLDETFLTLQKVMECIMRHRGGNDYKLPHMGKQRLRRAGLLPTSWTCDRHIYEEAAEHVGVPDWLM